MLIRNGNQIIKNNNNVIRDDKYLIGYVISGNTSTSSPARFYLKLTTTSTVKVDWGDGVITTPSFIGSTDYSSLGYVSHSYANSGIYPIRLIYDNKTNVTGIGLYPIYGIDDNYKKFPNLKMFYSANSYYQLKKNEYLNFNGLDMKYIILTYANVLIDYDSISTNIEYLTFTREYYSDVNQSVYLSNKLSTLKNLKSLTLMNHFNMYLDVSVLSGNTGLTSIGFQQTSTKINGSLAFLKDNNNITSIQLQSCGASCNLKGKTFSNLQSIIFNQFSEWNFTECFNSYNLAVTNSIYTYELMILSGVTSDLNSIRNDLTTLPFLLFAIMSDYLYGDISPFGRISTTYRFQLSGLNLYGDITNLNKTAIKPTSAFELSRGKFYGDCTFLTGVTSQIITMVALKKHDTNLLTNIELSVDNSNRTLLAFNGGELTTEQLNAIVDKVFEKRNIYNNAISKNLNINNNSGATTGVYQQPNVGTYSGNIHNLTETEINNLSNGLDYTGSGTNTAWTQREKMWILVNLHISSGNINPRYYWVIQY